MKNCNFVEWELQKFRDECNFTDRELEYFNLKAKEYEAFVDRAKRL